MKKILFQYKGFVKRRGGSFFKEVALTLNATDYKEPNYVIEYDMDSSEPTEYMETILQKQ